MEYHKQSKNVVRFSTDKPHIYVIDDSWTYTYDYNYNWVMESVNRCHFRRRIDNLDHILSRILEAKFRIKIYQSRFKCTTRHEAKIIAIDFQGFCIPEFVPKEIAIIGKSFMGNFFMKAPKCFKDLDANIKRKVEYLEYFHNGLKYDDGTIPFDHIPYLLKTHVLDQMIDVIVVKGRRNFDYLRYILRDDLYKIKIINVDDYDEFKLNRVCKTVSFPCEHHFLKNKPYVCSFANCKLLYDFVLKFNIN